MRPTSSDEMLADLQKIAKPENCQASYIYTIIATNVHQLPPILISNLGCW